MKTPRLKQFHEPETIRPTLRFTPTAWAKLQFFCRFGETEIGGFGVADSDDLLLVREFATVKQKAFAIGVCFDDGAVADLFEDLVDSGRKPEEFARIWCHTHPGNSATPSPTDEETFSRVFGGCDWAVMFILAREGQTYCRLRFNVGPSGELEIPVEVDYTRRFLASDHEAWEREYQANVQSEPMLMLGAGGEFPGDLDWSESWLRPCRDAESFQRKLKRFKSKNPKRRKGRKHER